MKLKKEATCYFVVHFKYKYLIYNMLQSHCMPADKKRVSVNSSISIKILDLNLKRFIQLFLEVVNNMIRNENYIDDR